MTIVRLISFTAATLASPLLLGISGSAVAQARAGHDQAAHARRPSTDPNAEAAKEQRSFAAIAEKLNTTPDALKSEYESARQANPKLTRGQFIAANLLAQRLGAQNPNITTQAMLDGLNSGKSIHATLQSLGVSQAEATEAQRQANREIRQAEMHARAPSPMKPEQDKPQNP